MTTEYEYATTDARRVAVGTHLATKRRAFLRSLLFALKLYIDMTTWRSIGWSGAMSSAQHQS